MTTRIRWYGESAFSIEDGHRVFVESFGDMSADASRGIEFRYPSIEGAVADVLLVTHDHLDHNAVEAVGGDPRSCCARREGTRRGSARSSAPRPSTTPPRGSRAARDP